MTDLKPCPPCGCPWAAAGPWQCGHEVGYSAGYSAGEEFAATNAAPPDPHCEALAAEMALIQRETDCENPVSWRADSREDCLDLVNSTATAALAAYRSAKTG